MIPSPTTFLETRASLLGKITHHCLIGRRVHRCQPSFYTIYKRRPYMVPRSRLINIIFLRQRHLTHHLPWRLYFHTHMLHVHLLALCLLPIPEGIRRFAARKVLAHACLEWQGSIHTDTSAASQILLEVFFEPHCQESRQLYPPTKVSNIPRVWSAVVHNIRSKPLSTFQ